MSKSLDMSLGIRILAKNAIANLKLLYASSAYDGCRFEESTTGAIFKYVHATGEFKPENGSAKLISLKHPVGIIGTFTGSTDGAIILGTPLGASQYISKGYLRYPANSIVASHAEGYYWTEFSDPSNAIVYNNTYTSGAGANSDEPVNKVSFSGSVPGGTGLTTTVYTAYTYTIPGYMMGLWGKIRTEVAMEASSTTGSKTTRILTDGGLSVGVLSTTAIAGNFYGDNYIKNKGAYNRQRSSGLLTNDLKAGFGNLLTIDTTVDFNLNVTLSKATAAETMILTLCEPWVEN